MGKKYIIDEGTLTNIADAIRYKTGESALITPPEMSDAIRNISGGGDTPSGSISIETDGTYNVSPYAEANVWYDAYSEYVEEAPDPSDWERPVDWQPEALYDESVEQLFMVYDIDLLDGDATQFACWYATTNVGDLLIERGYVADNGTYISVNSTNWARNSTYVEELPDIGSRYLVYRITPKTGHITSFYHDRPTTAFDPYIAGQSDYVRVCQPMVECYGSLPYVTGICYSSATRRFNTLYCRRFAIKNLTSLTTCYQMFYDAKLLECIDGMETWDTSNVTTFENMFRGCVKLSYIKCKFKVTSKCTNMAYLFYQCNKLRSIDTSDWVDTSKVTKMDSLFRECSELEAVDVSNLKGDSVTSLSYMFNYCYRIRDVDLSNFYTPRASNQTMQSFFAYCYRLRKVDISKLVVKATATQGMFQNCYELREIVLGEGLDTSLATNMSSMFQGCNSLKSIVGLEYLTSESATTFSSMFNGCFAIKEINVSGFKCLNVTTVASMFASCFNAEQIVLSDAFINNKVTSLASMFIDCWALTDLNITNWNTSGVTNMSNMFGNCRRLKNLDAAADFNYSAVTTIASMFSGCHSLESIPDFSNIAFPKMTTLASLFNNCISIKEVRLTGISAPLCTTMANMFQNCYETEYISLTDFDMPALTSVGSMFVNNFNLKVLRISNWSASKITTASSFIQNNFSLSKMSVDLDFSKITSLSNMFSACLSLKGISNFPLMPKLALTLSQSTIYTAESLVQILNAIPSGVSALKLTLGSINLNKLTDTQKAVATSKGWTLA